MLLLSLLLYIIIIIIVLRARGVAFVNTKPFLHLVLSYGEIARKWQYRMSINGGQLCDLLYQSMQRIQRQIQWSQVVLITKECGSLLVRSMQEKLTCTSCALIACVLAMVVHKDGHSQITHLVSSLRSLVLSSIQAVRKL